MTQELLVVGTGMAAMATVEALLEHSAASEWSITLVGREPDPPYNRMLLSQLLAGGVEPRTLLLRGDDWLAERGIVCRTGAEVRALDLRRRVAELADGEELGFERLVLATGSRALAPALFGLDRRGVHLFRTLQDTRRILRDARRARRAVVIGGGLLGLEAARGLRAHGVEVSVVHLAERLMEQQLDASAGILLQRALGELGVEILLGARAETLLGDEAVSGVVLDDGRHLAADMVVIAAGITPEVQLARDAGLEVDRGIVVDDELRTSWPGVYAVGECAQHRDVVYGLWPPLLEQAKVAGASLSGNPAAFRGAVPATTLKVAGVDLFCGGRAVALEGDDELIALDTRSRRYRRLLLRDERLVGTILLGDLRDARALREHLSAGARVPESLLAPMPPGVEVADGVASGSASALADDPSAAVCTCMSVTQGEVCAAISALKLESVEDVGQHTRAGTGCGTCRPDIAALLRAHRSERQRAAA